MDKLGVIGGVPNVKTRSLQTTTSLTLYTAAILVIFALVVSTKGAITSKLKHAIKLKTSPARLAQLLQPSLAFCFSLEPMTAYRPVLDGTLDLGVT